MSDHVEPPLDSDHLDKKPTSALKPKVKFFKIVGNYRIGVLKFVVEELRKMGFALAPKDLPMDKVHVFWSRSFGKHLGDLLPHQKVNFLPNMSIICRKDYLHQHIMEASRQFGREHFDFWPDGFTLPAEMELFIETLRNEPFPYILKPPLAARGEGIKIVSSLDDLNPEDPYFEKKIPLAQKYIKDPLLFQGQYKMTFRIYVLFTSVDPLRLYVYDNGLVRICSEKYHAEDYQNPLIHLTNWDLQKDNEKAFEENVRSNQMNDNVTRDGLRSDLTSIFELLKRQGVDTDKIWHDIKCLVAKTFLAVERPLTSAITSRVRMRGSAFELLGYDILLDSNYKPWLLEINHTPSLSPHTELENRIKSDMIRELLHLVDIQRKEVGQVRIIAEKLMNLVSTFETSPSSDSSNTSTARPPLLGEDRTILWNNVSYLDLWTVIDTMMEQRRSHHWLAAFPTPETHHLLPLISLKNRTAFLTQLLKTAKDDNINTLFTAIDKEINNRCN